MAGLSRALFAEPVSGDINRRTTHVEADIEGSQDAGSIPAASTYFSCYTRRKASFFMHLWQSTSLLSLSQAANIGQSVAKGVATCLEGVA